MSLRLLSVLSVCLQHTLAQSVNSRKLLRVILQRRASREDGTHTRGCRHPPTRHPHPHHSLFRFDRTDTQTLAAVSWLLYKSICVLRLSSIYFLSRSRMFGVPTRPFFVVWVVDGVCVCVWHWFRLIMLFCSRWWKLKRRISLRLSSEISLISISLLI